MRIGSRHILFAGSSYTTKSNLSSDSADAEQAGQRFCKQIAYPAISCHSSGATTRKTDHSSLCAGETLRQSSSVTGRLLV